jgi:hypothetical protein
MKAAKVLAVLCMLAAVLFVSQVPRPGTVMRSTPI